MRIASSLGLDRHGRVMVCAPRKLRPQPRLFIGHATPWCFWGRLDPDRTLIRATAIE